MRSFKDQLEKDFDSTFFNMNEFAELHNIDGKEVPVVVDNDTLLALNLGKNADSDGIFEDAKLFFILKKYLDSEPVIGQIMDFDGESYPIGNILEDFGGYTIILRGIELCFIPKSMLHALMMKKSGWGILKAKRRLYYPGRSIGRFRT